MARLLCIVSLGIAITGFTHVAGATECISVTPVLRSSKLAGQVFDRDGFPIVAAKVTVRLAGDHVLEVGTDDRGFFEVPEVGPNRGSILVSVWGFESVTVQSHIVPELPFQLLAVRLGIGMTCDSRACTVLLPSPTPLSKAPRCLDESPWASADRKWASTTRGLDRAATRCVGGNHGACLELARIAAKDKDGPKREYAAKVLTDQGLLAELAQSSSDATVRATVVGRLADQTIAAALAKGDQTASVRAAAVRRLTDAALLTRLAMNDSHEVVRAAATGSPNLNDESTLRAIAMRDPSARVRRAALGNPSLADQVLLASAATWVDEPLVRSAAVARLTDHDLLRHLALTDKNPEVRAAAVSNPALRDEALFAGAAKGDADIRVRVAALARITDPVLRRRVAPYVTIDAVDDITDPSQLVDIATGSTDSRLRGVAINRITDQRQLAEVLRRENDESVRYSGVINPALTDQDVLAHVAMHDPSPGVRAIAALKLEDHTLAQRVFAEVLQTDGWGRWHWGDLVVRQLTDQALLAKIATTDPMSSVRSAAVSRLEDQAILARIALTDASNWFRMIATRRLTDTSLLSRIGRNDRDWYVRQAAEERLKELRHRR